MLVKVTFPALLTIPEKTNGVPGCVAFGGQFFVTTMAGVRMFEHVELQVLVTLSNVGWPKFCSVPQTVIVSVVWEHGSPG